MPGKHVWRGESWGTVGGADRRRGEGADWGAEGGHDWGHEGATVFFVAFVSPVSSCGITANVPDGRAMMLSVPLAATAAEGVTGKRAGLSCGMMLPNFPRSFLPP